MAKAKLTGWKIDIKSQSQAEEELQSYDADDVPEQDMQETTEE